MQVFGNDACVAFAGSQGNFQLNVFKPVMVHNVLESIQLIGDACASFDQHCASGITPNRPRIEANLQSNLMQVTALNRHIGYDKSAAVAKKALHDHSSLEVRAPLAAVRRAALTRCAQEAAVALGFVSSDDFRRWVVPLEMCGLDDGSPA